MNIRISKSFLEGYWNRRELPGGFVEKAKKGEMVSGAKYIWRKAKSEGGYDYIYAEDQIKKPFEMLKKFFNYTKEKITSLYKKHDIEKDFKATETEFASHVLEYEAHKDKWDKRFSNLDNAKNYKNPKTMEEVKNKKDDKLEPIEAKKDDKKENKTEKAKPLFKPNNTLMRKVWAMMNPDKAHAADIQIANQEKQKAEEIKEKHVPENPTHFSRYDQLENVNVGDKITIANDKKVYEIKEIGADGKVLLSPGGVYAKLKKQPIPETPAEQKENITQDENNNEKLVVLNNKNIAIQNFENDNNIIFSEDTRELLLRNMNEYTMEALKNRLDEFAETVTPFTISHIDESIAIMDEKIKKEKHSFVAMYLSAKRDYLITLKNKMNDQATSVDVEKIKADEKVRYTEVLDKRNLPEAELKAIKEKFESSLNAGEYNELQIPVIQARIETIDEWLSRHNAMLGNQNAKKDFTDLENVLLTGNKLEIESGKAGNVILESGEIGKSGFGLKHIIEQRFVKDGKTEEEITALIHLILESVRNGEITRDNGRTLELTKNGIVAILRKEPNDKGFQWVLTGFNNSDSEEIKKEATDAITTVIADNSYTPEFSSFRKQVGAVIASISNTTTNQNNVNTRSDGLTQDEADALEYYIQDAGYTYINDKLRGVDETPMEENHTEAVKNIDNVIARNTVKEKTLYRGLGGNIIFPTMNPYEHRLMELYLSDKAVFDTMNNDDWFDGTEKYIGAKDNVEKYLKEIIGKTFTDKGYISTTKNIENTDTFRDSYKNGITIEFQNIPEGTHGIDLSEFDEAREFKAENEVLLHRDLNYKITGAKSVNGKIVLTAEIVPKSDAEKTQNRSEAMMGNDNAKGKHNVKPKTAAENKEEKKKENEARKKAGLVVPDEKLGERSSAIEAVDIQNNEFTATEDDVKNELNQEVKAPSNQSQKEAFNELAAAKYNLAKKEYGASFYGKMNKKLKATDDEVAEAQKRYDEALAKYNSLLGADNSDFSYNPNAENYAYRDTGYIAGSQKEKIAQFWADVAERGGGVNVEDIDWVALEENLRYAESKIIKSNILKKPDFENLRDSGMSGGAAYFYNRLLDCIPTKPAENTPEAHRNYVLAINTFQDRMEKCKTVGEMAQEMSEIADEMVGRFVGADKTPEVMDIQRQIDELTEFNNTEVKQFSDSKMELWKIPMVREFTENLTSFVRQAYGKPYPFAIPGLTSTKDSKLQVNFMSFLSNNDKWFTFMKENEKELMKYPEFKTYKEFIDNSKIVERKQYYQNRHVQLPTRQKIDDLEKQNNDIIKKINEEYRFNSAEHKMWLSFGDKYKSRFSEYMRSASDFNNFIYRGNKTILGHYENARRGKFDNWDWLPKKEENSVSGEKKERKESFQLLVATEHERKGGRNVSVKTTQELKEMFNLRDIQSGEWVLKDPKSAKWHVDRCCEGFADLSDITGIPENLVSLNGRLALAIGARGYKGALAHYEPVERVINITKIHGGGSLAHEWFHSFDNMLSEAMLGGNIDAWLTKPGIKSYKDAPDNVIPEVKQAFSKLVDAMKKGDNPVMKAVKVTDTDKKNPDKVLRSVLYYRNYGADTMNVYSEVMKATSYEEANSALMSKAKSFVTGYNGALSAGRLKLFQQAQRAIAAKFNKDTVKVFTGETASNFFIESWKLDEDGKKSYWSTTHEMAARAFSGFIGDNLRNSGRLNTYLTSHDTNGSYILYGVKPNPEGEERQRINAAFKELFDVVKTTNAIQKSINFLDKMAVVKNGRVWVKKGLFRK